jgi:glutathione peroxidase
VPVRWQGGAGREHGQLLRLHAAVRGLEALYAKYRERGLVVLGFPSNDFSQEPGSSKDIADFCYNTYGVKFPMLGKSHARQRRQSDVRTAGPGDGHRAEVELLQVPDRPQGQVIGSYNSMVKPDDKQFVSKIEELLNAR